MFLSPICCNVHCKPHLQTVQAVLEAGIIGPLVQLLQNAEFEIKKEAAWAISNATSGGSHEQIKYLFFSFMTFFSLNWLIRFMCNFN